MRRFAAQGYIHLYVKAGVKKKHESERRSITERAKAFDRVILCEYLGKSYVLLDILILLKKFAFELEEPNQA